VLLLARRAFINVACRAAAALILVGCAVSIPLNRALSADLPTFPKPLKVIWLDQGWDNQSASWFHHADQGTLTFPVPYEWFIALEEPTKPLVRGELLARSDYLDRFGFIPDRDASSLPIGFAHGSAVPDSSGVPSTNPATGKPMTSVGLTCAACHTGRLTYKGTEIRIDGGPANTNLKLFQEKLGEAILETAAYPLRQRRFEDRVLGPHARVGARVALVVQIARVLQRLKHVSDLETSVKPQSREEGFGRLDALNRIGNQLFSLDLDDDTNYAPESAPVHFPRIWDAPWFLWVQYNGSIEQPMVRNAGEALGVSAPVTLSKGADPLFRSGVHVDVLYEMETMLAGKPPGPATGFTGLRSPRWPNDVFPPIDTSLAAKGQQLYAKVCQDCHLPPVGTAEFWSSSRWTQPDAVGARFLDLELIPISHVGTDASQATVFASRKVRLPSELGIPDTSFGPALGALVARVVDRWYDDQQPPTPPDVRKRMNGDRPNNLRMPLKYKVRPLDGIWATPPYLHNASVPTLYDLLSPANERPPVFYLGNREYDPEKVGLRVENAPGLAVLDTSLPGNRATGHEFSDTPGPGVIGSYLQPEERRALIEYLKTL
jgi:hypothetical protein